jgi:hypothetical protein
MKENKCVVQFFCNGGYNECKFRQKDFIERNNDSCYFFHDGMCSNELAIREEVANCGLIHEIFNYDINNPNSISLDTLKEFQDQEFQNLERI